MSFENIPTEWQEPDLAELAEFVMGQAPAKSDCNYEGRGTVFVKAGEFGKFFPVVKEWTSNPLKHACDGDVLICVVGATAGKLNLGIDCAIGRSVAAIRSSESLGQKYLYYFLKSKIQELRTASTGSAQGVISKEQLGDIRIPFSSSAEQKQIAAKLDELLAQVDTIKTRLDAIPHILKRFRQSVLAAAVSGKLTEEWRTKNPVEDKLKLDAEHELSEEAIHMSDIPETWEWIALGNYANCSRGRFSVRPRNDPSCFDGEFPFIQIGDLPREGGAIRSYVQTLNKKGLSVSKSFKAGTVVVAIVGATIGNTGVLNFEACFPDSLVGIEAGSIIQNTFIEYYFRSIKSELRSASYAGGGQPNIKLTIINSLPFPMPSLEEQTEIVRRVEQLFAYADQIEQRVKDAQARVNHLTQSILAKAFRGELTADWRAQNPDLISGDNSAEALLARIRAEREAAGSKPKTRKPRTTKNH